MKKTSNHELVNELFAKVDEKLISFHSANSTQTGYWASAKGKRTLENENAEHLSHKRCSDQSYLRLCSYLSILTDWIFGVVYWSQCI